MLFKRFILHIFYPTRCPVCGSFIEYNDDFCDDCKKTLTPFNGIFNIEGADGFCAPFVYNAAISPAIMLLKNGIGGNSDFAFGAALAEKLTDCGFIQDIDIIIPVPLNKKDKRIRGYNQSELIAKQLSARFNIPVYSKTIAKIRYTEPQKSLSKSERITNLKGAFALIHPELIRGKRILLIDDVCTTGSTLREITTLLKNNSAAKVYCASCCKTELLKE